MSNLVDFNDLHVTEGLAEVKRQVDAALEKMQKAKSPAPSLSGSDSSEEENGLDDGGRYSMDTLLAKFSYIYGTKFAWDSVRHEQMELSHLGHLVGRERYKMWNESPSRKTVLGIRFEPGQELGPDWVNLYTGFPLQPMQGECSRVLEHIKRLCRHRAEEYEWLLKWLAYPLQNPGAKMATAVVVYGSEGTGKSITFDEVMGRIYGEYKVTIGQAQLESSFTEWQSKKLFAVAEEVVARTERNHYKGMLKHLVTGSTLQIDQKHHSLRQETNHLNMVFLSNSTVPLELDMGDRRYMVLFADDVPEPEYFKTLFKEINNGGVEAFMHHLMTMDLGDFDEHSKPPVNQEKHDLIGASLTSPQYFHMLWKAGELEIPYGCATSADLYKYFAKWCEQNGEFRRTQRYFGQELKRVMKQGRWRFSYPEITFPQAQHRVYFSDEQLLAMPSGARVDDYVGEQCRNFKISLAAEGIALD